MFVSGIRRRWVITSTKGGEKQNIQSDRLSSSLRELFVLRPKYMAAVCDALLERIDRIVQGDLTLLDEKNRWDVLLQEWYGEETVPFKKHRNYGEMDQFFAYNTHDAILPQGMFQAAQTLLQSRSRKFGRKMSQSEYPLTSRIRCSECGSFYHRKVRNGIVKWVCSKHAADTATCNSGYYSEERIYDGIITMINKLRFCEEDILGQTIQKLEFAAAV